MQYNDAKKPTGPLCEQCLRTYKIGYHYMKLKDVAEQLKNDDFRSAFKASTSVRANLEQRAFKPCDVTSATAGGFVLKRKFWAFRKSEFKAKYNCDPHELNFHPVDLKDELGDSWSCYLVPHDDPCSRELEVYYRSDNAHKEFSMQASDHLHDQQALLCFAEVTKDPKTSLVRKVKKSMSHSAILAAIEARARKLDFDQKLKEQEESGAEESAAGDAEEASGAKQVESPAHGAEGGSAVPEVPATPQTPVSTLAGGASMAVPPSAMPARSIRSSGSFCSPGKTVDVGNQAANDWNLYLSTLGPARSVDDHILRLPIAKVLGGWKPGHQRRWAQDFVSKSVELDSGEFFLLTSHLEAVDAALRIFESGATMASDKLANDLKLVLKREDELPTNVKMMLVTRRLKDWKVLVDKHERVEELMKCIVPWSEVADDEDDEMVEAPVFAVEDPCMCAVEGSQLEKGNQFKETLVKDIIIPNLKVNETNLDMTQTLSEGILNIFIRTGNISEENCGVWRDMLLLIRITLSIMTGGFVTGCSECDVDALMREASAKSSRNLRALVANTVEQNSVLSERLQQLRRFAFGNAEHRPAIDTLANEMQDITEPPSLPKLQDALALIERVEGKVSRGTIERLLKQTTRHAEALETQTMAAVQSNANLPTDVDTIDSVLTLAQKVLGQHDGRSECVQALRSHVAKMRDQVKIDKLAEACAEAKSDLDTFGPSLQPGTFKLVEDAAIAASCLNNGIVPTEVADFVQCLVTSLKVLPGCKVTDEYKGVHLLELLCPWRTTVKVEDTTVATQEVAGIFSRCDRLSKLVRDIGAMLEKGATIPHGDVTELRRQMLKLRTDGSFFPMFKEACESVVSMASTFCNELAVYMKSTTESKATKLGERLRNLAGGKDDGTVWWAPLTEAASLKTVMMQAKTTLMKADGKLISSTVKLVSLALKDYSEVCELNQEPLTDKPQWYTDLESEIMRGNVTEAEALIINFLEKHHSNPVKLKNLVKKQVGKLNDTEKNMIHPTIKDAIDQVSLFSFQFPVLEA